MLWFLRYFISKLEIRQIDESRKSSVSVIVNPVLTLGLRDSLV